MDFNDGICFFERCFGPEEYTWELWCELGETYEYVSQGILPFSGFDCCCLDQRYKSKEYQGIVGIEFNFRVSSRYRLNL